MIAIHDKVLEALVEGGYMKSGDSPVPLPTDWATAMLSGGATAAQTAKTVKIGRNLAYTKGRNDLLVNRSHPKHPAVHFHFSAVHYGSFTLVMVVPLFPTIYTHKLDPSELNLRSSEQIRICWTALRRNADDVLLSSFSPEELRRIRNCDTRGWTWHHCVDTGVLVLVPSSLHRHCGHTGGDALWTCKDRWKNCGQKRSRPLIN